MAKIVDADALELRALEPLRPKIFQIDKMPLAATAEEHVPAAGEARQRAQHVDGGIAQDHVAPAFRAARLVVLEMEYAMVEVDVGPAQGQNLRLATAGVQKQAQRIEAEHPRRLLPREVDQCGIEALELVGFQKVLNAPRRRGGERDLVPVAHSSAGAEREQAFQV